MEGRPDQVLAFWEVGDSRARDVKAAAADPALAAMPDGPAKDLLTRLALTVEDRYDRQVPDDASLLLMAAGDGSPTT
jgi:hypothetical protein